MNKYDMVFMVIPAGTFMMGSPEGELGRWGDEGLHEVCITQPFLMKETPVTNAEWASITGGSPGGGEASEPVTRVSWYDAVAFCNALSRAEGLEEAYVIEKGHYSCVIQEGRWDSGGYRLPTEAEWEYACRAGTTTAFHGGEITSLMGHDPVLDEIGWYSKNSGSSCHSVGQKEPNDWGLYDMHGNVSEWVWDWYDGGYYAVSPREDPRGPEWDSHRVLRGGNKHYDARHCRAADRSSFFQPNAHYEHIGFRICRTSE